MSPAKRPDGAIVVEEIEVKYRNRIASPVLKEGNVTVMVSDMNSAIQFYVEKLGLTLKARYSDQFAQVAAPGLTIALHPADKQGQRSEKSEGLSIGLRVDNLERTMKDLEGKGLKFSRVAEDGPVRLAFFKDPDGNPLYLAESRW